MDKPSFIVGDAGGTGTQWRVVREGKIAQFETMGFNAYTHQIEDFARSIQENIQDELGDLPTFLYAAGVDTLEQKQEVERALQGIFEESITVQNDLIGVARSLCGDEKGNVCILGTGSNACFYDGQKVNKVSASLGYILGDEGSGAYLGKKLLMKIFRNQIDSEIVQKFTECFDLNSHQAIQQIYHQPKPNHFLASFAPFIYENRNHPEIYQLIYDAFCDFYIAFFSKDEHKEELFHFSGSIAFHFSDILRQVGSDQGFGIKNIVQSPIAGLVLYHQNHV
jgi:glucosamine kinase